MRTTRHFSLSAWLALLVLGAVVPLLLFAGLTLRGIFQTSRALADRGQVDTTRALALAVDGEVRSWKAALAALAESKSNRPGRLAEFYEEARQVGAQHDGWIGLTVASGEQLFNTLLPYGAPLQKTSSPETIAAIFREGKPIVSDLIWGKNAQRYLVAVAVPVRRGGKVVHCLTLNFSPDRLTQLLRRQQVPASWVAAISDTQRRVVARSVLAEARVGKPVAEWVAAATRAAERGVVTGPLMDGRLGQLSFQRLHEVPWVVALGVPVAELQSAAPIWGFLSVGLILGLVAVGMAVYMGRKIVLPVRHLARTSARLLRGEAGDLGPPTRVREVQDLQHALIDASAAARAHTEERERAAEELRRANEMLEARVQERTAALRESQEDLSHAQAVAHMGSWRLNVQRNELLWSDENWRIFGVPMGTPLTYETFLGTVHPEDRDYVHEKWSAALRGAPYDIEHRIVVGDTVKWVRERAELEFDHDGKLLGGFGTTQDTTERKEAEEEIQNLARFPAENPNPVLRLNHDGIIVYANAAGAAVLGEWRCSTGDRAPDPWPGTIRDALAKPSERVIDLECGDRTYSFFVAPIPASRYVNLYASDITPRKRAEEALRKAHDSLEEQVRVRTAELSEAIGTLERQAAQLRALAAELTLAEQRERRRLAEVLHDGLQQLLVAARVRAHMLGRSSDPGVRHGCQEMVALLEEALAEARTLTGELSPPTLQKGGLLPALEWLTRWMGEKHHLTVRLRPPAAPLPVLAEDVSVLLYQAVRELLLNTVKYAQVTVAEVALTQEDDALTLTVADAGVGFDPNRLRILGGTEGGFGLFGIRERLEIIGGRLRVESASGRGSRFTLVAPLRLVSGEESAIRPREVPAVVPGGVPGGRRTRVLVVDDHALVRRGFATLLAGEPDLEVVGEAADGKVAIELARQLRPDVILMDVSMPVLNGIEATRAIHVEFPAVRVIGLSVLDATDQPAAMEEAGAVAYLSKSDSAEALLAAIRGGGASPT